jgi:hypothetical protein
MNNSRPPALVAFLRGLAEAVILAGLGYGITVLSGVHSGELAPWAPVGLLLLRQLEGVADHIDETKRRAPERGAVDPLLLVALLLVVVLIVFVAG